MTTATEASQETSREQRFISFLEKLNPESNLNANRKAFAELRRSLAFDLGKHIASFPYVEPMISPKFSERKRAMYYLVAGLYANHPLQRNLEIGEALSILKKERESDSLEKRFLALLATDDAEQLAYHLRQMIALLKQEEIGLDYVKLLRDLFAWQHFDKYVQRKWAQKYYRYQPEDNNSQNTNSQDADSAVKGN